MKIIRSQADMMCASEHIEAMSRERPVLRSFLRMAETLSQRGMCGSEA